MRIVRATRRTAFSLIEVMIAIGVFSFCIVGIVYLLGTALDSTRQSQRDSALRGILQNTEAEMGSLPISTLTNLTSTNFYFDAAGNRSSNAAEAIFRAVVKRVDATNVAILTSVTNGTNVSPGASNAENHFLWVLQVATPPPSYSQTNTFLLGRSLFGSAINGLRE